jgi:hypothetical protein
VVGVIVKVNHKGLVNAPLQALIQWLRGFPKLKQFLDFFGLSGVHFILSKLYFANC